MQVGGREQALGDKGPAGGKFAVAAQGGAGEGSEEGREVMPRGLQQGAVGQLRLVPTGKTRPLGFP